MEDVETQLYEGCETFTKLSAIVTLYKIETNNGIFDNAFYQFSECLKMMFLPSNMLPESIYKVETLFDKFDLDYVKIHACLNE